MSRGAVQSVMARLGNAVREVSIQAAQCPRCRRALSFGTDGNGRVIEHCDRCGEVGRYRPRSSIAPPALALPFAVDGCCPHCKQERPGVCIRCGNEAVEPGTRRCTGCRARAEAEQRAEKAAYLRARHLRITPGRFCTCGEQLAPRRRVCDACRTRISPRRTRALTCDCGRPKAYAGRGRFPEKCPSCDPAAEERRAFARRKRKALA
jgi:hypothetical protein